MIEETALNSNECFFIRSGHILTKIAIKNIHWVNSDKNYLTLYTPDKKHVIKASLKKMESFLPQNSFIRVHRSYLARINKIDKINFSSNELHIGESVLPIGRKYKEGLLDRLNLL